ncbi:MBL fold metallo-hydrolase [Sphingomonas sp. BK580]|uniref:MBL fold metallo-hydrolase n=1 Tax=Sphingomonas sp. BK580 TaxID=2586972 RepID=UPI0016222B8E|nr:MBL fold metallo-hydrolase [Sphingomonas sp. BK580]MBB3695623.1 glyoxylase-like metal-dependent hydrolase (beta-lactamase superfamily II) [Sphingomonas sp. BK580]
MHLSRKIHLTAALSVIAASLSFASPIAAAAAPAPTPSHVTAQLPNTYDIQVGDVRVTALSDGSVPQDLHQLLHRTTNAHTDELIALNLQTNPVEASLNAFLLRLPGRLVLVDTGSGQFFGPGNGGKLLDALARVGVQPDQVSDVLITHAHDDHSGGLVKDGKRVFLNATVHVGKADVDFFFDNANQARTGYDKSYFEIAQATLKPYLDAGKVKTFTGKQEILPGVTGEIHTGHTPGSAFYTLESRGERLIFVGDIVHVAAVQFPDPTVTITYDLDEDGAVRVRAQTFAALAQSRDLIAVPHLPFPGLGHVRTRQGGGYDWVPVTYTDRAGQ